MKFGANNNVPQRLNSNHFGETPYLVSHTIILKLHITPPQSV